MARKEKEGGDEEEEAQEEGKAFKKTFTKKSKKIGRSVSFEDQPFKVEAEVKRLEVDESPCIALNPVNRSLQVEGKGAERAPENLRRTHLDPKSKKKCILFSSIFNVDRPFQRYLLKTSGPGENNPITKRKNNFFSKFPRCKISTSTFSEIGNKKKINGFGVWSGPFFLTWVRLKGSV